ncbi:hypothetical protein KC349_g5204 [Hortaea werneckii]|nr:hypothetical protein KC349_g5204 [Hortaea werneckii]
MSDEPRRSGRASKGVHKSKASSSPAPNPQKPSAKVVKKSKKGGKTDQPEDDDEGEEEEAIRCICGDDNPKDKRAFIGCDACTVWQHNVCMGMPEDDDDVPDHYFCEECRPEEHKETLAALAEGKKIWEERTSLYKQWKKMSSSRRKSKGKGGEERAPWLKKEAANMPDEEAEALEDAEQEEEAQEPNNKRKRESVKPEPEPRQSQPAESEEPPPARPDKRRKSSQAAAKPGASPDTSTAVVEIEHLPSDRKKVAQALSKIIMDDISERARGGFRIPDGDTARSLGDRYAGLIEYSLFMNYDQPTTDKYKSQFRSLNANLKRNKLLIERLLDQGLTPDDLATMESKDMASEELQRERAKMKEDLDRQAVMVQDEGPRMRRTHKGDEIIEDETFNASEEAANPAPVRERASVDEGGAGSPVNGAAGSPPQPSQTPVDTKRPSIAAGQGSARRQSSQQFDASKVWGPGSGQSPTGGSVAPRPMQMPPRRRSSVTQQDGAKEDADVDRMLQDDEGDGDDYEPSADLSNGDPSIVWRGKLIHAGEGEPVVNARFVAGRDLANERPATAPWKDILPQALSIDGRLQIGKAEEYLCGLQWSQSSDVSVLALTPWDDSESFKKVFEYFQSRQRYAVVNKDKPNMIKDLYIIPVEAKSQTMPEHIEKLEHCTLTLPTDERLLLATLVVHRNAQQPEYEASTTTPQPHQHQAPTPVNGTGAQHLPQHMRLGAQGPSGSPLAANAPTFSPQQQQQQQHSPLPPNPYIPTATAEPPHHQPFPPTAYPPPGAHISTMQPPATPHNPLFTEILGPQFATAPTALAILNAEPQIGREKLENLKRILEESEVCRTNIEALGRKLMGG